MFLLKVPGSWAI